MATATKKATKPAARRRAPARKRDVDLSTANEAPEHITEGKKAYAANKVKNAATRDEKKAKDAAFRSMAQAGLTEDSFTVETDAGVETVDLTISAGEGIRIDIEKLHEELVTKQGKLEEFLSICSTSQTGVKDVGGSALLARVSVPYTKEETLSIKKRKA